MKTISTRDLAAVKRVAATVHTTLVKRDKLVEKINKLNEELAQVNSDIQFDEAGIVNRTGHTSEELLTRVVNMIDKVDKEGKPYQQPDVKYVPKEGALKYDEELKAYVVLLDKEIGDECCEEEDFQDMGMTTTAPDPNEPVDMDSL